MLLSGKGRLPKPVWFTDAKMDEIEIRPGDRVVLIYRHDALAVIQNLSMHTFLPIYRGSPAGCFSVIAGIMAAVGIFACITVWIWK